MEEELKNLKYTLEKYNEVIEDSNLKLKNLRELYKNNYEAMLEEKFKLEGRIITKKAIHNRKQQINQL